MFQQEIHTEIEIDARPDAVWAVLTDLASYPEWNPMVRRASGELRAGARLTLHYAPAGRRARSFRPVLLVVAPGRELSWEGRPAVPGLVESVHRYALSETAGGGTHLDHDMVFRGLLIPPFRSLVEHATREPFQDQNRALKERVERAGAAPA